MQCGTRFRFLRNQRPKTFTAKYPRALAGDEPAPGIELADTLRRCWICNRPTGWRSRLVNHSICGSDCLAIAALKVMRWKVVGAPAGAPVDPAATSVNIAAMEPATV